ncbi:MAG: DNA-binding protein [Euryarchaeota archaeon]|nr:DNA-binding protein [Euryarchaeota archaeon]
MILVLDAGAFIAGFDPLALQRRAFTVPQVVGELRSLSLKVEVAREQGLLTVRSPGREYLQLAARAAERTGDVARLSQADIAVLALALELASAGEEVVLVTDDYALQNVAASLGLRFSPVAELGIRRRFRWYKRCTGCGRRYSAGHPGESCPVCGSPLKLRRKKR